MEAYLRSKLDNIFIEIFDPNLYEDTYDKISDLLKIKRFEIIGFSPLHLTLDFNLSLKFYCLEKSPESLFIVGRQEATFNSSFIFENFPELDVIIAGEGKLPLKKLIEITEKHTIKEI